MARLNWTHGSAPDRSPRTPIQVFNVPIGPSTAVRFLGRPWVCLVHGKGRRSYPCVEPEYICPFCADHKEQIPCGYVPAQAWIPDPNAKMRWVLVACCLTDHALTKLQDQDLRGHVFTLTRVSTAYNAKLVAAFREVNTVNMPDEFDVVPIVERCWINYLVTFGEEHKRKPITPPVDEAVPLPNLVRELGDLFAQGAPNGSQPRNGKGGVQ